ncbi:MAG: hypothetical protein IKC59_03595 [Clostridia bacterium]|nr:hypothetical protein [Clostridia bacterium]
MSEISIEKLDRNMEIVRSVNEPDVCFYNVRTAPFEVYGLYNYREERDFKRMPDAIAQTVNTGVKHLNYNTAGGRVRFSTDSQYVAIRAIMPSISHMSHFAMTGSSSFDLFIDDPASGISRFHRPFRIDPSAKGGYESIIKFETRRTRYFTVNFPTYSSVRDLWIGLQQDATVGEGMKYRDVAPIVYYGSSITQGGCASRPGNIYQNIISRRLNMDYVNLGFSGNGRAEDTMVDYLAGLQMSAFVSDYDHNAPNVEHLEATHCKMYDKIRAAHPDIPYIMISRVDFDCSYDNNILRRDVIMNTYRHARANGDSNVYYIDGAGVFRGPYQDLCTVDGCHPTDVGFALMADAIGNELERAFTQHLF